MGDLGKDFEDTSSNILEFLTKENTKITNLLSFLRVLVPLAQVIILSRELGSNLTTPSIGIQSMYRLYLKSASVSHRRDRKSVV